MELTALQAFVAVAEAGSFSRAADTLFLTQPAISKRIAALEDDLRARLFDRMARSVELTEAGRALLPHARRVLGELETSRQVVADLSGTVGGRLRIGTSHHVGLHRLPPILRRYTSRYPDVELDLHFMDSEQACQAVDRGELELAVVTLPENPPETLAIETLWPDALDFVAAPDHPLAGQTRIEVADLAQWPAILPAVTTFTRRIVAAALRPSGAHLRIALETNYLETIKMMVSVGLGWSALPRTMNHGELTVLTLEGVQLQRRLGLVSRVGRTPANAAGAFVEVARGQARSDSGDDLPTGD
ncbi:LysR family transcriptional regulator [Halofilum ochraceum]|uniref:LysR family transcriptional regulator n=1 Tax=Halofilum ochraceum TaxID=1611323 RepID=UPI0008D9F465|nr:LysR family transcriptional regulator [Halofilum ochraceum]